MKIILDEDYYIDSDGLNYTLKCYKKSFGKGKNKTDVPRIVEQDVGYYTRVEGAVRRYITDMCMKKTADYVGSLEDYCKRIENIMKTATETEIRRVK